MKGKWVCGPKSENTREKIGEETLDLGSFTLREKLLNCFRVLIAVLVDISYFNRYKCVKKKCGIKSDNGKKQILSADKS